jgi:hypothetical protein
MTRQQTAGAINPQFEYRRSSGMTTPAYLRAAILVFCNPESGAGNSGKQTLSAHNPRVEIRRIPCKKSAIRQRRNSPITISHFADQKMAA